MKILKDSRQMPKKQEQVSNKMYSDVVYAWLQTNSDWDRENNIRWIAKKDVKYIKIAECLGISRQTASTKFKKLLDKDEKGQVGIGLVVFNSEKERYELPTLSADMAMLIENGTLRKMLNALNENAINVYIYLLNRFLANKEQPFKFEIDQVKQFIGISTTSRGNNYIISDILLVLQKLGLIEYELISEKTERGDIRSLYQINAMSNYIKDEVPIRKSKC